MKYIVGLAVLVVAFLGIFFLSTTQYQSVVTNKTSTRTTTRPEATILFTGDVMLGRNVENLMNKYGQDFPFKKVGSVFKNVDGIVINLEGPVLDPHVHTKSGEMRFSFPASTPALLARYNIKLVSLANNHTVDYGEDGFRETQQLLDGAGVMHAGHPFAYGEEYVTHTTIGGQPFVFVAFNLTNPHFDIQGAIDFTKTIQRNDDEYFVAMIHGGDEYELISNTRQQTLYRGLIDAGVDAVIAHHPHVTQEIELYHGKPIFYSLGNFIFDQYFSRDVEEGLALKLTLSDTEAVYELMPVKGGHSQPYFMNEPEKSLWLNSLSNRSSSAIHSDIQKGKLSITR